MTPAPDFAGRDEAVVWRDQLTLSLLRSLLFVFAVSVVPVWLAVHGMRERYLLTGSLVLATAFIALPAYTGLLRGPVRGWMVIAPAVVMSLSGYASVGYLSGCGASLTVTMMLTGLLLGRRAMIGLIVFCALILGVIAWAMVEGHLHAPDAANSSPLNAAGWARSVGVTFLAIGLFGSLILAVVMRMEQSLRTARLETVRRQQAERVALEARQLELVGRLAAGVAHDFNNNLTSIMGCAELLQLEHEQAGAAGTRELTDSILQSSQRLAELTRQLLAYSRKARMLQAPVDLHLLVSDAVSLLRRSTDPNLLFTTTLAAKNPMVTADVTLLQSAVLNLLVNARDAMPTGGTITVSTTAVELPEGLYDSSPFGACIVLEVRDTGAGIAEDVLPRIFDPFFTTKPLGRGTGLGLAAVSGTIKAHGGTIHVERAVGVGTTSFRVTLRSAAPETSLAAATVPAGIARGDGHILLVEDDGMVSQTAIETLKSFGYSVTHAADGATALGLVREAPRLYDLVLLDLRMPGMSGEETFEAMRGAAPHLKILVWSGYAAEQDVSSMLKRGAVGFVQKPYRVAALSRTIADALNLR